MRIGFTILSLFYSVILLGNSPPRILSHDGNETAYVSVLENYPYVTKINYTEASLPATLTGEAHGEGSGFDASDPLSNILDGNQYTKATTGREGSGTELVFTMYGLEAGQEVQIFYDRETFARNDIQFNGVGIGSVRGTYEWSDTLLAIDGTNIIKLIPNPGTTVILAATLTRMEGFL